MINKNGLSEYEIFTLVIFQKKFLLEIVLRIFPKEVI
jgi:hypothetical protein